MDYSNDKDALRVLSVGWWYFFSKFIDLLDTVFFIMRKKFNQVSALHVIHHSTLPWLSWWGPRFVGGGHAGFGPFLNSGNFQQYDTPIRYDLKLSFLIETSQILSLLETLLNRCSHNNVFLLHVCSFRTKCSEISLVEEVYYHHSVGPICACVLPCHSTDFL